MLTTCALKFDDVIAFFRPLEGGDIALAFYNRRYDPEDPADFRSSSSSSTLPTPVVGAEGVGVDDCKWNHTVGYYIQATGANIACDTFADPEAAKLQCCADTDCKEATYTTKGRVGFGCLKRNVLGAKMESADGYIKLSQGPQPPGPPPPPPSPNPPPSPPSPTPPPPGPGPPSPPGSASFSIQLSALGSIVVDPAAVFAITDVWGYQNYSRTVAGSGNVTAINVPVGGTALLRLTKQTRK